MRLALIIALAGCGRIGFGEDQPIDSAIDAIDEPGLIAWYRFEDDPADGRLDDSAGSNQPALCVTGLTCGVGTEGRIGQGLLLDGTSQFYRLANDPSLVTPASFTIAFWARLDTASAGEFRYAVTKRYGAIHNSWGLFVNTTDTIFESAHEPGPEGDYDTVSPPAAIGDWKHYALTWNDTTKRGYVDGVRLLELDRGDVVFDDSELLIGADQDNADVYGFWPGALDEIRIYDRVLSDLEIQQLSQR